MNANTQQSHIPFVDLAAQYSSLAGEIEASMLGVLRTTDFILGKEVNAFEEAFARYCGVEHAIGLDTGMSALELALEAYDIGAGDEVITVANSFIATALSVSHSGARPVLVDADPVTYSIDVSAIERAITPRTKAIMPVHLYGLPVDMDPLMEIAARHHLIVIEDACQGHGARYKGRRAGSIGHAAAFSFYPGKNLGAYGDGGMLVTHDAKLADRIRMLRNYGQREKYHHSVLGYNRRLDTIQAAVLSVKLPHLDQWNAARRGHAQTYSQRLAGTSVLVPVEPSYAESVWHLYVIRSSMRDALKQHLTEQGISVGLHYPVPIHLQVAYKDLGYHLGDFPVSEAYALQSLSLPMFAELTLEQIARVTDAIQAFDHLHHPEPLALGQAVSNAVFA